MGKTILFVDHDDGRSGSTVSLEYLVKAFKQHGYVVFVHTPKKKEEDAKPLKNAGAVVIGYGKWRLTSLALSFHFTYTDSPFSWKGIRTNVKECIKFFLGISIIKRAIRETKADLVYTNEYVIPQASIGAHLCGVPAVVQIRSPFAKGTFGLRRRFISWLILRYNRIIFAITQQEAEQLRSSGAAREKIKIVPEFFSQREAISVDQNEWRRSSGLPEGIRIVTMLGGIYSIKGTLDFLRAAQIVVERRSDVVFVIAGRNWQHRNKEEQLYADDCQRLVDLLAVKDAIRMVGETTRSLGLIASSDIVVSPSTQTHFSRPVIEAWGFNKPVLAMSTVHMKDLITENVDGMLIDVGDYETLARCILTLVDDDALRQRLGNAGKKRVAMEFDADVNTRKIVEICDNLIHS